MRTRHEAPCYVVFSTPFSPRSSPAQLSSSAPSLPASSPFVLCNMLQNTFYYPKALVMIGNSEVRKVRKMLVSAIKLIDQPTRFIERICFPDPLSYGLPTGFFDNLVRR